MKKTLRNGKKVLSVFMAALMVMTAWVFFAPEAKAADVRTYSYSVTFEITDEMSNVCMIFELFGKENNGTGNEVMINSGSWKDLDTKKGKTYTVLSGNTSNYVFPTRLVVRDRGDPYYIDRTLKMNIRLYVNGGTKYLNARKIETGRGSYEWRSGDPAYFAWNSKSGAKRNVYNIEYAIGSGDYPYVNSISDISGKSPITMPKTNTANITEQYTATAYDQYNVVWHDSPTFYVPVTEPTDYNSAKKNDTSSGLSMSTAGLLDISSKAQVLEENVDSRTAWISCVAGTDKFAKKEITLNDPQYEVNFIDSRKTGPVTLRTDGVYYGNKPSAAPTNYQIPVATAEGHYFFDGWKPDPTNYIVTDDVSFFTQYKLEDHDFELITDTAATCTQEGSGHNVCKVCGYTVNNVTIPAKGHHYEKVLNVVAPTCTKPGYTVKKCIDCNSTTNADVTVALGHDWVKDEEQSYDATCINGGKLVEKCSRCGDTQTTWLTLLGHDFENCRIEYNPAPTCTTDGIERHKCSRCDAYDPDWNGSAGKVAPKLGHDWGEWVVIESPTCLKEGKKKHTCKREGCGVFETRDIDKAQHEEDTNVTLTLAPTCTAPGYDYHPCKNAANGCTEKFKIDGTEKDALGHLRGAWTVVVKPGCESTGIEKVFCTRAGCGAELDSRVISATGHSFTKYVVENEATCTTDETKKATCDNGCGKTDVITKEGSRLGHSFTNYVSNNNATCTEGGTKTATCDRCAATDTIKDEEHPALGHLFTNYKSNNNATCTEDGTKTAKCDRCYTATNTITDKGSALGHDVKNWTRDGNATCCDPGTKHGTCVREGCGFEVTNEPATGESTLPHVFTEYVPDGNKTCIYAGTLTARCDNLCQPGDTDEERRCKATNTIDDTGKLEHSFPDPVTEKDQYKSNNDGTCTQNGTMTAKCKTPGCNAKTTVPEPDSKRECYVTTWISDNNATCTEDGTKHGYCTFGCGREFTEVDEGSALGHHFRDYKYNNDATCTKDGTRTAQCERIFDVTTTDADGNTVTEKVRCDATDKVPAKGTALGHDWGEWAFVKDGEDKDKAPNCETGGEQERFCKRDDCSERETRVIGATGHNYEWVTIDELDADGNKLPADCELGYQKIKVCSVCKEKDKNSLTTVPGGAHHYVVDTVEATCVKDGSRTVYCDVCKNEKTYETTVIKATGHLNTEIKEGTAVAPTCKDEGYTGDIVCLACGEVVEKGKEIPKTDVHTFSEYTVITPATCTKNAIEKAVCSVCKNAEDTREVYGSKLGHKFGSYSDSIPATCTEDATQVAKCENSYIVKSIDENGNEVETLVHCDATDVIKKAGTALGHDWGEWVTVTPATCKNEGLAKKTCKRDNCGKEVEKVLRQLSHTESDWIIDEEATCTKVGKRHKECTAGCGYVFATEEIPMKDHDFIVTETTATCIDDGFSTYTCTTCGATKKGEVVHALGHDWGGEWVVTTEPTCTKKGVETLKCTRCDEAKTRTLKALGHDVVVDPAVPATCTKDGLSEGSHCGRCGEVLVPQETVVKPHYDGDDDGKCDECGKEIKHSTDLNCNCICHKRFWLMRVLYKILLFFWKLFKIGHGCACGAVHY